MEPEGQSERRLPSVDRVLRSVPVVDLLAQYARAPVTEVIREVLRDLRLGSPRHVPDAESVGTLVRKRIAETWTVSPRTIINATGVVLHTNLGRAPLSKTAIEAMVAAAGYSTLEYDLQSGSRGSRHTGIAALLHALTGSEAAHLTVNNASAVLLSLAALAKDREVVVSRGQAVEIGGGFRIPVILQQSGARLVEVGTTNRTRLSDYAEAITARTAAILHVHTSNFRLVGFTQTVHLPELATLARDRGLYLIDDNGSGAMIDTSQFGLAHEPMPAEALAAGAHVVAFSGDKLLGGPQAGIILGATDVIEHIRYHPLARALRPDKVTLAGLDATLLSYLRGRPEREIPVWKMISQSAQDMETRARAFVGQLQRHGVTSSTQRGESTVGGGSLPGETLPTTLVILPRGITASRLRDMPTPVIARTHDGHVLLDLRTVLEAEVPALLDAVCRAAKCEQGAEPC